MYEKKGCGKAPWPVPVLSQVKDTDEQADDAHRVWWGRRWREAQSQRGRTGGVISPVKQVFRQSVTAIIKYVPGIMLTFKNTVSIEYPQVSR